MQLKTSSFSYARTTLGLAILATLGACSTPPYRCPLDPGQSPDSLTACTSMQSALAGAKASTGGAVSVMLDDEGKPAAQAKSGAHASLAERIAIAQEGGFKASPAFEPPKLYQMWTPSQIDGQGVFHEARQSWLATTGRWRLQGVPGEGYKPSVSAQTTVAGNSSGASGQSHILRPAVPSDSTSARYTPTPKVEPRAAAAAPAPAPAAVPATPVVAQKEQKASALSNFSAAITQSAKKPAQPIITAPAVNLAD